MIWLTEATRRRGIVYLKKIWSDQAVNMKLLEQNNSAKTNCEKSVVVKQDEGSANSLWKQERLLKICSLFTEDDVVAIAVAMQR